MELPGFFPLELEFLSEKEKLVRHNTNVKFNELSAKHFYQISPLFLRSGIIHLTSKDGVDGLYYLKVIFASIHLKLKSSLNLFTNNKDLKGYNLPAPLAFL